MARGYDGAGSTADGDQELVTLIRRGDDRAFEALYARYHRRIHAYVLGMVKDHGRAEDLTQEVFVSALRRMRETEQPLTFKPWLYQIAKNSCIDAFRRSKRAEEISIDADDALAPADQSRLIGTGPSPDAAVAAKQDLNNLCGAFGGLSETHHEILVLRELEGLSYQEIGRRMGMSRPAVESTLFRARRRLTEEYDDIVSGARCRRIQQIILTAVRSPLGARDTRRLARHVSHCRPCRREALAAGLDRALLNRPSVRERVASRIAGLLPFPIFLRFRRAADAPPLSGRGTAFLSGLPQWSQQLQSGWGKAAAGAAVLVAGVGAGVTVQQHDGGGAAAGKVGGAPVVVHASPVKAEAADSRATPAASATATATASATAKQAAHRAGRTSGAGSAQRSTKTRPPAKRTSAAAERATPASGETAPAQHSSDAAHRETAAAERPAPTSTPAATIAPAVTEPVKQAAEQTRSAVRTTGEAVKETAGGVQHTAHTVTAQVDPTVQPVAGPGPVAAEQATDGVDRAADGVADTVGKTVDGLTGTLNGKAGQGG